ncbi:MAG: CDP-archaeol synthase [Motiliproteus sp.]
MLETKLLILLVLANGFPILADSWLGKRNQPLDSGYRWRDGRALLGCSKTVGGLSAALLFTPLSGWLLGWSLAFGFGFAIAAMLGDLLTSFIKRRLGLASSSSAVGLDQIPESLLPLLFSRYFMPLDWSVILLLLILFGIWASLLSWLLFKMGIKNRPF